MPYSVLLLFRDVEIEEIQAPSIDIYLLLDKLLGGNKLGYYATDSVR